MKVSVIVALYNTGDGLRDLVASLDRQTMPREDFEVVLVDDGSSDDTLDLARELASTRPNLVVETIPNSGWPGRPRNVGTDLATGEYVFFSDHDDAFGPLALERMYGMARANDSDIVYGKVVRQGRNTPYWTLWRRDVGDADLSDVVASRTVHKLYRRCMLVEHDIRFLEGRVRLEDHEFMAKALPRAKVVSVLASVPSYYWIHRNDGSNNSSNPISDADYWRHYAKVLDTWAEHAGPGQLLDDARVISVVQAFSRFPTKSFLGRSAARRAALVAVMKKLLTEHCPPDLDRRLPVLKRLCVQALRAGDGQRFARLQEFRSQTAFMVRTTDVGERDGRLHVGLRASLHLATESAPLRLEVDGDRLLLPLPADLDTSDTPADARLVAESDLGSIEVTIRHRTSGVEWPVPTSSSRETSDRLTVEAEADVDTVCDAFGSTLEPGIWDVYARVQFLGDGRLRTVDVPKAQLPSQLRGTAAQSAYVTARAKLAFKVAKSRPSGTDLSWDGTALTVRVCGTRARVIEFGPRGSDDVTRVDGSSAATPADQAAGLTAEVGRPEGIVDFWTYDDTGERVRLAYRGSEVGNGAVGGQLNAYSTLHGYLSVKPGRTRLPSVELPRPPAVRPRIPAKAHDLARMLRRRFKN